MTNLIKTLIKETLNSITEIDWDNEFSDVKQSCTKTEDVVEYLNKVRANSGKKTADREKFPKNKPYVHAKSSFFKKDEDTIDIDYFIERITTPPKNIISSGNDKMAKTGSQYEFVYSTGIPAFRGIVYSIKNKRFHYINTCPGAGDCVLICYALRGNYVRYPVSYDAMTRRLNYLLNYPDRYEQQMYDELKAKCEKHKAFEGYRAKVTVRWNDSGDFFTRKYVKIAQDVIARLKADGYNVDSYAYTKVADVAKDNNFGSSSFSSGANKKQSSQVTSPDQKRSVIVPKELFADLDLMRVSDEVALKDRISQKFGLNRNDIITYEELMNTPKTDSPKWHVIVVPGDGDDAAIRHDVKTVLLTQH